MLEKLTEGQDTWVLFLLLAQKYCNHYLLFTCLTVTDEKLSHIKDPFVLGSVQTHSGKAGPCPQIAKNLVLKNEHVI